MDVAGGGDALLAVKKGLLWNTVIFLAGSISQRIEIEKDCVGEGGEGFLSGGTPRLEPKKAAAPNGS